MTRKKWSAEEFKQLFQHYPETGLTKLVGVINRSEDSITAMARRFGLKSANHRRHQVESRLRNSAGRIAGTIPVTLPFPTR